MNFLLLAQATADIDSVMNSSLTLGEKLSIGGQVTGLGLGIVFSILIILWGVLGLFRIVFYDIPNKKKAITESVVIESPDVKSVQPVIETISEEPLVNYNNDELIAVISAAVSASMGQPTTSFKVVSFKRVNKNSDWNRKI